MANDRSIIDPDGRYPVSGQLEVEAHALQVLALLPGASVERTRDVIQIDGGGDEGLAVVITPEAIELRLPTIEWTCGPHGPAASSRLWKRLSTRRLGSGRLGKLIAAAQAARTAEFKTCRFCDRRVSPEHCIEDDLCHGCAERHLGVVF